MARLNNKTLLGVFVSFLIVLALIAVVRAVFPATLYDGFSNMSCYGVKCNEGEFCQEGVCRPINPGYTNDYYNKGVEGFADSNTWAIVGTVLALPAVIAIVMYFFFIRTPTPTPKTYRAIQ